MINFFKGHPTRALLPAKEIADAYTRVLLNNDYLSYDNDPNNQHPLTYGTDIGNLDIRNIIGKWVNQKFGISDPNPDCINLTAGASYGMGNILSSVTSPSITQRAFIVSPTYFLINSCFLDVGLEGKLTAVDETPDGEYSIDLEYLESQLIKYSQDLPDESTTKPDPARGTRKYYRFVMYLVPTYSNPGGLTYSLETRIKLLELARKYDMLLISDDVYEFLNYTGSPLVPRFNQLDQATVTNEYGNTISNGTFSKIIAPGLRVGWQETATPKLADQLSVTGPNKSGGSPNQLSTFVVADLITTGKIDEIISKFVETYKEREKVLQQSIVKYLPKDTKVYGGDGGYFVWVTTPSHDASKYVPELAKRGVVLAGGEHFEVTGDEKGWGKHSVRLSISFLTKEEIEEGIKIWGEVLN
ncbi:hypothetical protein SBY92_003416 [Candida maltosa Xu316]|uniref:Aminotransferase class I/classII large domain-containing protein n=1 Tax=Candida maltosa (strain Xu316) TaxID=1245528 RepID=M3J1Q5_CANMX|nr:hypothetical protein G210_3993 [Candida maltosa Xu316]